ncbi:MAG TPA: hypothetical protein VKG62_03795 [Solirubrobacteraceae bacterium]|nr:hypothetical protein [Solirubrobacteraceae bacterium]
MAALVFVAVAVAAALVIDGVGGGSHALRTRSSSGAPKAVLVRARPAGSAPARPGALRPGAHVRTGTPSPGSLPQTNALPSGTTAQFRSQMASLWGGIVTDSPSEALVAFFPKDAYIRLKAIPSASSDWTERLLGDYALDIAAAHSLLGVDPEQARLIGVSVPSSYAHWVPPGVCYNAIGYYEVPNARVLYSYDGELRSFGIASMISWRGVWYVVHLGAVLRSTASGVVDEPASGPGTPAYSGTC